MIGQKLTKKYLKKLKINLVVQVNGKTRDVIRVKKDVNEKEIFKLIIKNSKAKNI